MATTGYNPLTKAFDEAKTFRIIIDDPPVGGIASLTFRLDCFASSTSKTPELSKTAGISIVDTAGVIEVAFTATETADFDLGVHLYRLVIVSTNVPVSYGPLVIVNVAPGGTTNPNATTPNNTVNWLNIVNTPTTLAGYGITDGAIDATLAALAGQNWSANSVPVGTGVDTVAQVVLSASTFLARASTGVAAAKPISDLGLSLVANATVLQAQTTLGVVPGGTYAGQALKVIRVNAAETALELATGSGGGGGTWGSIAGTLSDQTDLQNALNAKLSLAGGTMTGALLFTDNSIDIGASGATRPRTVYAGTSVISPLFTGNLTGNVTGNTSGSSGSCTGNAATATLASTVTVADSTSAGCYLALTESASGSLAIKTDAGARFDATTGTLTASVLATTTNLNIGSTGAIVFGSNNVVMTHSAGVLTMGAGDLRITTAGSNNASAVTVGGTQTLANKTLATATLTGTTTLGGDLALGANNLTMTGTIGSTGSRVAKLWATDITCTNAISGSVTGNASTVTTNANLTGPITSIGNATSIASQTGTGTTFAMSVGPTLTGPFQVNGAASGITAILKSNATTPSDLLQFQKSDATVYSRFNSLGNFGYGTAPSAPVHVLAEGESVRLDSSGNTVYQTFYNGATRRGFVGQASATNNITVLSDLGNVNLCTAGGTVQLAATTTGVSIPVSLNVGSSNQLQVDSSGHLFLPNGASGAGNLALSFTGDTNTGFYRSAADEISVRTGDVTAVTVDASQRLLINTAILASSAARLQVLGIADEWAAYFKGAAGTGHSYGPIVSAGTNPSDVAFAVYDLTTNNAYFRVRGDGITTVQQSLHVGAITAAGAQLQVTAGAAGTIGQIIKLAATPSAHALDINSSSGSGGDLAYISQTGGALFAADVQITTAGTGSTSAVTCSGTQTLSNKTLTAPRFANSGFIADANGNEQILFITTTSAVNYAKLTNSATGVGVLIEAAGDDATVNLRLRAKSTTGKVVITDGFGDNSVMFDVSGTTNTKATTLVFSQTNDRSIAFPDASGTVALQGLAGTKIYYVSDTLSGLATRKLTFVNGVLTAET